MSIEVSGLRKQFGRARGSGTGAALDDVSLKAAKGEFVALLGPSGSGKTTLLRVVAGLEFADQGHVLIDGRHMEGVPARERGVGLMFQHYALFRHMTVADNIGFGLRIRKRSTRPGKSAIAARTRELLELIQLPDYGGRYPDQLSGGQRQRVALARALAIEPRVLLLDEPFGALDAKVRKDLRRWLRALHDRMQLTTLMVTHDQSEALELADRVAVMRSGKIDQIDTPEHLLERPNSPFVHAFLGESIRFDCRVENGHAVFEDVPADPFATGCKAGPAIALIRPHEIALIPVSGRGAPAVVRGLRATGPLRLVDLELGGRMVEVQLPERDSEMALTAGTVCALDLRRAQVYPAEG
jgi:sulfate transport system ATP-binding protein